MIHIVTKATCPYCSMAKQLLDSLHFDYKEVDVLYNEEKFQEIKELTGMMTVPQVFAWEIAKDNLLWGFSEISELHEQGELVNILKNI